MRIAYLDIETNYVGNFSAQRLFRDYENHRITVLGIRILDCNDDHFTQLVGKDVTKTSVLDTLGSPDLVVTYNGRSIPDKVKGYIGFDFPVIASQLGITVDKEFPHLDLCPACWQRGLWGGQKAVEQSLGLKRTLPGKDGAWASAIWRNYETTRDSTLLKKLLEYNREDVFMLRRIQEIINV